MFPSREIDTITKLCKNIPNGIVRITSPKLRPMAVQYTGHVIHVTTILHCTVPDPTLISPMKVPQFMILP